MHKALSRLAIISCLLFGSTSYGAGSFSLPFESVRDAGRGFSGLAADLDDVSAQTANPAALAWIDQTSIAIGGTLPAYRTEFSGAATRAGTDGTRVVGGQGGNPGRVDLTLPDLAAGRRLSSRWSAGLRLHAPFGITLRYDSDWTGRYHAIDTIIRGVELAPSFALQMNDRLAFGAAPLLHLLVAEFSNDVDLGAVIQRKAEREAGVDITSPACELAGEPSLPGKYDFRNRLEVSQPALGLQLGALWRYSDAGQLGISWRSPIRHRLDGDAVRDRAGWTEQELRNDPCLTPVAVGLALQGRSLEDEVIQPAIRASSDTGFRAPLTLPETLLVNLQHGFGTLQINAGARWTRWSRVREFPIRFTNGAPSVTEPLRFEDSLRIGAGLDWQISPAWTLRSGWSHEASVVTTQTRTARAPDGARQYWSAGGSWTPAQAWSVDAAVGLMRVSAREVRDLSEASDSGNELNGRYSPLQLIYASLRLNWNWNWN